MGQEDEHPNLAVPGKPRETVVQLPDGTPAPYQLPQTKWDNCWDLSRELGDRAPTAEELARWQLTAAEYEHFSRESANRS